LRTERGPPNTIDRDQFNEWQGRTTSDSRILKKKKGINTKIIKTEYGQILSQNDPKPEK
jgi:hypothetical protein